MLAELYGDVLRREGFAQIARLDYRLHLTAWWNAAADKLMQVIVLSVGRAVLLRGDKSYFVKSVSAEGETWARDVGLLHDYLENHFPELRLSFSHFRDVPSDLAKREVQRRTALEAPTRQPPTVEQVAQLQRELLALQQGVRGTEALMTLSGGGPDLLSRYVRQQAKADERKIEQLQSELERQQERMGLLQHLQREYQRKGSAAAYSFTINSNIHCADDPQRFGDALRSVVKEVQDMNRYQVTQKLGGGRLNIQVAEATEPALVWITQWLGGALPPAQMQKLTREFESLRRAAQEHVMVTPDEPIIVENGQVRHFEKRLAARVVSDILRRLDKNETSGQKAALTPETVPPDAMPLTLGHRVDEAGCAAGAVTFPLTQMVHVLMSGTTGSGKSFAARVLVEEAAQHPGLSILVLDPRNQSVGILVPEDRPKVLQQYPEFGMKPERARGFDFSYFAPGLPFAEALPASLSTLAKARSVVSLKGLDDEKRCACAAQILDAAFQAWNAQESELPRLLLVVDEAQLFTRKRLDDSAREAAAATERALDRIAREGRKFGIVLALVSQTMKDFSYELASIRQMATTKIFLRNSDREIEYAADIVGDGRLLVQLPTGTALIHNGNWGVLRVRFRPPYSKVYELGDSQIRTLLGPGGGTQGLTTEARRLAEIIAEHEAAAGAPLNMSRAGELAGIHSKRKLLDLVGELESAGVITTRRLSERGHPRVIELRERSPSTG